MSNELRGHNTKIIGIVAFSIKRGVFMKHNKNECPQIIVKTFYSGTKSLGEAMESLLSDLLSWAEPKREST